MNQCTVIRSGCGTAQDIKILGITLLVLMESYKISVCIPVGGYNDFIILQTSIFGPKKQVI